MPGATLSMPKIVYGTAWKKGETARYVKQAVLAGFRGIDTACQPKHYQEELVGQAIAELASKHSIQRSSLWIQTKYTAIGGQDPSKPLPYDPRSSIDEQVRSSVQTSLSQLGVDYLDGLLLHSPLPTFEQNKEAWKTLESFVEEGKILQLGISNIYQPSLLLRMIEFATVPVSIVQNRWWEGNGWDWEILDICKENGIRYQSFWTLSGNPALLQSPPVTALAEKYGLSAAQVLFKFCQSIGITPLSGTTTEQHMKDDVAVEATPDFADAEVEALEMALRRAAAKTG
ncbi:hypothetical protein NCC49_000283 [Naganishia albida]|nr:hypothetical protein NCC49_000283 [Naganishia albida]